MRLIYHRFLKRFSIVRGLAIVVWKHFFPICFIGYGFFSAHVKRLPLRSLSSLEGRVFELCAQQKVDTTIPTVFPRSLAARCSSPHDAYIYPRIYLIELEECLVRGSSNLLVCQESIVHHDLMHFSHDYTCEEVEGRIVIRPQKKFGYFFNYSLSGRKSDEIPEAAVFTDALGTNYAHFISEVLPRIHLFVKCVSSNVPLIIDAGLHANLLSAIRIVVGAERQLLVLEKGQEVLVNKLHVISACGYVPFERRPGTANLEGHSQGLFSPEVLHSMRQSISSVLNIPEFISDRRKIFIRRNSGYRNVINSQEIEDILVGRGFEVVEPERLSFAEQVSLFSSAGVVVGATGAAFANLVFCNPETRLVIMIAELENTSYYYWQNMACASGNSVTYVLGKIQATAFRSIHSDFYILPQDVLCAIGESVEHSAEYE